MNFFKKNKYNVLQKVLQFSFIFILFFSIFINYSTASDIEGDGGITAQTTIDNPIRCADIPCFIDEIIGIVLVVGIPLVTLAIIYSGFLFVFAQGNPEKLKTARQALVYTLIGAALLLGAFVLSEAIQKTVNDIG